MVDPPRTLFVLCMLSILSKIDIEVTSARGFSFDGVSTARLSVEIP